MELNFKTLHQSSGKQKESRCLVFTSSTKHEIRHFHVVVVQKKRVMHVHSCCFANLLLFCYCFFSCPRCRRRRRLILGSFSNDDGDGNEDVKKAIGLLRKTTTLHAFLYISLPSLDDYDVKMPNCMFYGGRNQATTNLFFSI